MVKTGSTLPRRALATGLAACAHLLVLLLLGWKVPRFAAPSRPDDGPVVTIALLRPEAPVRRQRPPAAAEPVRPAPSPPPAPAKVLTAPAPQAPLASAPVQGAPAPVPPNVETSPDGDHVRNALRGLLGCTSVMARGQTREEREVCDRKLAAAKPAPVGPLYTAKEAEAFNTNPTKESIFVRKPHNECLPHIGALPPAANVPASGAKTTGFGIACEWDFW